jgi:transcriptional regulator of acetoin/glycerol metabolism
MSIAAARLGIGRTTLYRKLQKYKIPVPRWAE